MRIGSWVYGLRADGRHVLVSVGVAVASMLSGCSPPACVSPIDTHIAVGEDVQLQVGKLFDGSSCRYDRGSVEGFVWWGDRPEVARVDATGHAFGLSPGTFRASARRGSTVLELRGFVLPRVWTLEIKPRSARIRVGESVAFRVVVKDENGRETPRVPFSLTTDSFLNPALDIREIIEPRAHLQIVDSGIFRAERRGATTVSGSVAGKTATAKVEVID